MHGAERPFDADGADVREERVARCRTGLDRRAAEAAIEIEQRCVLGGQERGADGVHTGRRTGAYTHRGPVAEERFGATFARS